MLVSPPTRLVTVIMPVTASCYPSRVRHRPARRRGRRTSTRERVCHPTGQAPSERALVSDGCMAGSTPGGGRPRKAAQVRRPCSRFALVLKLEPYICRLPIMHGAVTNGIMWQFFTFTPKPDGVGGTYLRSVPVDASWSSNSRAVLTGILKDMVRVRDADVSYRVRLIACPPSTDV